MKCSQCGRPIPAIRLQVLPLTDTCVRCSTVKRMTAEDLDIDSAGVADVGSTTGVEPPIDLHREK